MTIAQDMTLLNGNGNVPQVQVSRTVSLRNQLHAALEHARRLTALYGTDNIQVAIAWETVEELQVALTCRKTTTPTPFAQYCAAHPDAPECRLYED